MKRNDSYWQKRAKACAAENFDDANQRARAAIRAYQKAIEDIEKRIKNVLKNAEAAGAMPNIGASPINLAQRKELFAELNALLDAAKSPQERKRISRLISSLAYEYRITRLEELKAQAEMEIIKAAQKVEQLQTEHYTEAFERSYYTTIHDTAERFDRGINFAVLDKRTVEEVLNEPWAGSTFSKRLWKHSDGFASAVNSIIAGGIASGASVSDMAKELEKYVNSPGDIQAATYRLVRTETAHFAGEADKKAYKEAGTPDYRVVETLDSRTCSLCGSMDGKVFPVSQAATGKNYPPFHPNCRGTTIAERSVPKTRIARDPQTGKNYTVDGSMTYEEWLEILTPEQKTALEKNVRILRNKSADKKQYERYKERLGAKNVPKTFDKFQDLKYNDSEKWKELKGFYRYKKDNAKSTINDYRCAAELHTLFPQGSFHIPPKEIDIKTLGFDDEHVNKERGHKVTRDEATEFVTTAKVSRTVWKGLYERYYSDKGAAYVNLEGNYIRTAFKEEQFEGDVIKIMEVLKKHGY